MPKTPAHALERRAELLSSRLGKNIDRLATFLSPRGRTPFTTKYTRAEAIELYRSLQGQPEHDALMARLSPEQQLDLSRALSQQDELDEAAAIRQQIPDEEAVYYG